MPLGAQKVLFYCVSNMTQIYCSLMRYRDQKLVKEAKVISYEAVSSQHCPLTCTIEITPPKQRYDERCGPSRIKWW
ncbi:hypothetical protein Y032_0004g2042 [Ancylostoma ceylanicum]|uniref:Uncharacterized protein n=1 Tax=Ancylostoma ceylanicum TaxID=53326 RepID=A0A016VUG6_9BILA|nr:hypothetical protein Y032_0004g2042 [Ancylostoma ceylanicum]